MSVLGTDLLRDSPGLKEGIAQAVSALPAQELEVGGAMVRVSGSDTFRLPERHA
jgi:hypothetical protein